MSQPGSDLSRRLRSRHIQLIAIGGTIGVGLFLGSARAIHNAGPALVLAYALGGIAIFFIMRALGELLTYRPVAGSFATYADEFCGPFAGFVTGWSYWFAWIATAMAELTAIGVYVRWWLPAVPQWLPALVALLALYGSNLLAVRMFGELEFWFALIKVVTIVALIVSGVVVIVFHVGDLGAGASFSNLWSHGGFLPYGVGGMLLTMQIVMFAYVGVELIGVTAGEAQDPKVVLPRATNGIILRILIFYIGALIVIMALVPWNELSPSVSPFVFVFEKLRVPAAAGLINLVVITAASSSCNSGLFSTGRMLWALAQRGHGPRPFARLSPRHVPAAGIHASAAVMLLGVALNYMVPERVFIWVTSVALVGTFWTWGIILVSHLNYRRAVLAGRVPAAPFRMPGAPFANWAVLAFLVAVSALLWRDPDNRVALYVAPVWFGLLTIGYLASKSRAPQKT
ncbi:MAG: proline-specific permease ProY [Gammaproteobacteria bacterium 13_2_20CM_66_19]|nr:MAG: proline-specific permease ProY [Gammaproteobacteria bacterium 13_2_20CM_66_19]TLZ06897.1 MAG: amino acid permease [Gammaproteobacteria bacterium]TLZ09035.1 MAG: amino acid permease [Gammaproteobacteria bacterium]TLZ11336.1 MAG: amino acid permease [Gammaproteobacteria bacterium]TLZ26117.1 MAG: amino acid permease [Gammaproteobacteria bacterium]